MRHAALLLIALTGACRFYPFGPPPPPPHVELTAVSVSPTVVHAGDPFSASVSAAFSNCSYGIIIQVSYAGSEYSYGAASLSSVTVALTAVPGQTVVTFEAACNGVFAPMKTVTIQVLPAQ